MSHSITKEDFIQLDLDMQKEAETNKGWRKKHFENIFDPRSHSEEFNKVINDWLDEMTGRKNTDQ